METLAIDLWHGSSHVIKHPEYGLGKPNNDYGRGFYCTRSIELAKEWACAGLDDGFANRYTLATNGLTFLGLSQPPYHPELVGPASRKPSFPADHRRRRARHRISETSVSAGYQSG